MTQRSYSSGFTAIELLITLFVAAAFLAAGYQLFNLVIKDGGSTRAESAASNVAYDYLRRYSDSATNPCTTTTPLENEAITIEGVASPIVTVSITCPQSTTTTLSRIEVSISYGLGSDTRTIKYATFVDRSRGTI